MSYGEINKQILKLVREISGEDEKIACMLEDLLMEEIKHREKGLRKDFYIKKIEEYVEKRS